MAESVAATEPHTPLSLAQHSHLRFRLGEQTYSLPLTEVDHLAGYATLSGEGDAWFLGWLRFQGELVPVFDLGSVLCDAPTPAVFGSRILLIAAPASSRVRRIGLLAAHVTDTVAANDTEAQPLDLAGCLTMLLPLIPPAPVGV